MKAKQVDISTVFATCPICDGDLIDDNGSMLLECLHWTPDHEYTCIECGAKVQLPKRYYR